MGYFREQIEEGIMSINLRRTLLTGALCAALGFVTFLCISVGEAFTGGSGVFLLGLLSAGVVAVIGFVAGIVAAGVSVVLVIKLRPPAADVWGPIVGGLVAGMVVVLLAQAWSIIHPAVFGSISALVAALVSWFLVVRPRRGRVETNRL